MGPPQCFPRTAIEGRTKGHTGYAKSEARRLMVERVPVRLKNVALLRKTKHRGVRPVNWLFVFALTACDLVRIRNLEAAT